MNSNALQLSGLTLSVGSLDAYIQYVNQIPLLTAEEEYAHAKRYQTETDIESARHLVLAHLRYVVRVARGYLGYGLALNDLIQEGNVGLMKAVKRFDPEMGVRLVSFAIHWIKAEIHEFVLRNWRIVKIATTKAQRKLFFNLKKLKNRIGWFKSDEAKEIAEQLQVSPDEVLSMEERLNAGLDISFDKPLGSDDSEEAHQHPVAYLHDPNGDPAHLIEQECSIVRDKELLDSAFERLDERSQDILQQRWLNEKKATLNDLADKYALSAERVRQLEKNAMKKLRQYIEELA